MQEGKEIVLIFNEGHTEFPYVRRLHPFPRAKMISLTSLYVQFDRP